MPACRNHLLYLQAHLPNLSIKLAPAKRRPVLVPDHHIDDGINAVKLTFPRLIFNGTNCRIGIEALRQYRAEWDDKARVFRTVPRHDWASPSQPPGRFQA
jgi:hypothetical protein